jgi:hypothetical protein
MRGGDGIERRIIWPEGHRVHPLRSKSAGQQESPTRPRA